MFVKQWANLFECRVAIRAAIRRVIISSPDNLQLQAKGG